MIRVWFWNILLGRQTYVANIVEIVKMLLIETAWSIRVIMRWLI